MRFKLVENVLNESAVSSINRSAKQIMKQQVIENGIKDIDVSIFDNCLRHHIYGKDSYESKEDLKNGTLSPTIIIPNIQDDDFNQNIVHSIIEYYSGKNVLDLIKYVYKLCNLNVIYHSSKNGIPDFRKYKLHTLISELNKEN